MKMSITLSQACDGVIRYKSAVGMSPHTIRNYRNSFTKLQAHFPDDPQFQAITRDQLVGFLAWLRDEYVSEPDGAARRGQIKLSPKSILNIHTDLSALWTWGVEEGFIPTNLIRAITPPSVQAPVVEPFTKEEIAALLTACDRNRTWKTRQLLASERPTADRDRAIILLLLDTGLRASELCNIQVGDINLTNNGIKVLGKGQKERLVVFGKRIAKELW